MERILLALSAVLVLLAPPAFALEPGQVLKLEYNGQPFTHESTVVTPECCGPPVPYEGPPRMADPMYAVFYLTADAREAGTVDLSAANPALVRATFMYLGSPMGIQWERSLALGNPDLRIEGRITFDAAGAASSWQFEGSVRRDDEAFRAASLLQPDGAAHDEFQVNWPFSGGYQTLVSNDASPGVWTVSVIDAPFPLPAIPEPAPRLLLAAGLLLLAWRRRPFM